MCSLRMFGCEKFDRRVDVDIDDELADAAGRRDEMRHVARPRKYVTSIFIGNASLCVRSEPSGNAI